MSALIMDQPLAHGLSVHGQVGLDMEGQALALLPAQLSPSGAGVQADDTGLLTEGTEVGGLGIIQRGDNGGKLPLACELSGQ